MAAVKMSNVIDAYVGSKSWSWNKCDCIGLMFALVNEECNKHFKRSDYLPSACYDSTIRWLIESHSNPLTPYLQLLDTDAGLERAGYERANLIVMHGGDPIDMDTGEKYPIEKVPGLAFRIKHRQPMIFGRRGLVQASIYPQHIRKLIGYRFKNLG
ncbi:MAG: hypothetical protein ISN29_10825 [Gammaproteobacteria bacterium AqS3]|nr:hypothetical protein [Gammaproteobacteria bacterium AqS3]